jgi:hypothetical protein
MRSNEKLSKSPMKSKKQDLAELLYGEEGNKKK